MPLNPYDTSNARLTNMNEMVDLDNQDGINKILVGPSKGRGGTNA